MAELIKVNAPVRKPLFEGVQGENEARSIQFDITPWVEELGDGAVTATAKRSQDSQPYPVTVTKDGNTVTWKPTSTDTAFAGVGSFQLEYTVDDVLAKTCICSTMVAPSLDPAGDPPDPYENWLAEMRQIAADAMQSAADAEQSAEDAAQSAAESLANQYGAFIVKSASGDIASFNDGADNVPMKSINVTITPKQSGSGDPSPSNVRPITGTSTANVTVTGTNVWDEEWEVGGLNGSNGATTAETDRIRSKNFIPVMPNTVYALRASAGGGLICCYDSNKAFISSITGIPMAPFSSFTTPSGCAYIKFGTYANYGNTYNHDISINYPASDTAYHPYNPDSHTTPVPLGQTVYGGKVDVVQGVLTISKGYADFGQLNWSKGSGIIFTAAVHNLKFQRSGTLVIEAISNEYKPVSKVYAQGAGMNIDYIMRSDNSESRIYVNNSNYTSAEDFKLAMSGVQLVYELETPTTIQLTPTQVATLLGTNNVWSNAGSVAVEYRADPTLAYNELANVIVSLGGNL